MNRMITGIVFFFTIVSQAVAVVIEPFDWRANTPMQPGIEYADVGISYSGTDTSLFTIVTLSLGEENYLKTVYFKTEFAPDFTPYSQTGTFGTPTINYGSYDLFGRTFNTRVDFSDNQFGSGDSVTFLAEKPLFTELSMETWAIIETGGSGGGFHQAVVPEPQTIGLIAGVALIGFALARKRFKRT